MALGYKAFTQATHTNGNTDSSIGTTTTITPAKHPRVWFIYNGSSTDILWFSLDEGTNFFPLNAKDSMKLDLIDQKSIIIKSDGASQPYYILTAHYIRD